MNKLFKLLLCVVLITLVSCKKNGGGSNSTSNSYYFNCVIGNKDISLKNLPATDGNGDPTGYVSTTINGTIVSDECSTPGSYCFTAGFSIAGQTTGIYTSNDSTLSFDIFVTSGDTTFDYTCPYSTGTSLTINITNIQQGIYSPTNAPTGVLEGRFSGVFAGLYSLGNGASGAVLPLQPISGSFLLPNDY